jgi:hypothetical protein
MPPPTRHALTKTIGNSIEFPISDCGRHPNADDFILCHLSNSYIVTVKHDSSNNCSSSNNNNNLTRRHQRRPTPASSNVLLLSTLQCVKRNIFITDSNDEHECFRIWPKRAQSAALCSRAPRQLAKVVQQQQQQQQQAAACAAAAAATIPETTAGAAHPP